MLRKFRLYFFRTPQIPICRKAHILGIYSTFIIRIVVCCNGRNWSRYFISFLLYFFLPSWQLLQICDSWYPFIPELFIFCPEDKLPVLSNQLEISILALFRNLTVLDEENILLKIFGIFDISVPYFFALIKYLPFSAWVIKYFGWKPKIIFDDFFYRIPYRLEYSANRSFLSPFIFIV